MRNISEVPSPKAYQQSLGIPMVLADHEHLMTNTLIVAAELADRTVPRQTHFRSMGTILSVGTPLDLGRKIGVTHIGLNYDHSYDFIEGDKATISLYGTHIDHNAHLSLDAGVWGFAPNGCDRPLNYLSHGEIVEFLDLKMIDANFGNLVDQVSFDDETVLSAIEKNLKVNAKKVASSKTYSEETWGMIGPNGSSTAPTVAQLNIAELQHGGSRYTLSAANQIEMLKRDAAGSDKIIKQLNYSFETSPADNNAYIGRFNNFCANICLTSLGVDNSVLKRILRTSKTQGDDIILPLSRSLDTLTQSLFGRLSA